MMIVVLSGDRELIFALTIGRLKASGSGSDM